MGSNSFTALHLLKMNFQFLGEEADPHSATIPFQVVVESHKVPAEPPVLQAKLSRSSQDTLSRTVVSRGSAPASLLPRATQPLPAAISVTGEGPGPGGDTSRAELAIPGQQTGGVLLLLLAPPASL